MNFLNEMFCMEVRISSTPLASCSDRLDLRTTYAKATGPQLANPSDLPDIIDCILVHIHWHSVLGSGYDIYINK
jgi:hypothetical protein